MRLTLVLLLAGCEAGSFHGTVDEHDLPPVDPGPPGQVTEEPVPDAAPPLVVHDAAAGAGTLALTLEPGTASLVLGETRMFTVGLTSQGGFAGEVALQLQGLPPSWKATFTPQAASLAAGGSTTVELRLDVPTTADAVVAPMVVAAAGPGSVGMAMPLSVTVAPEVVIRIPAGALNLGTKAFGELPTQVRYLAPGTKVTWKNDDAIPHQVHGPNQDGFAHQQGALDPGATYSVIITRARNFDYFCHLHTSMRGRLEVLLPPP